MSVSGRRLHYWRFLCATLTAGSMANVAVAGSTVSVARIALSGDPAAGFSPGVTYALLGAPVINQNGEVAILGGVSNFPSRRSIWAGSHGALRHVVAEESLVPASAVGGETRVFRDLRLLGLSGSGDPTFQSRLVIPFQGSGELGSAWLGQPSGNTLLVRDGSPVTDGSGETINVQESFFASRSISNSRGEIITYGSVRENTLPSRRGVWTAGASGISTVARESAQAVGFPAGVRLGEIGSSSSYQPQVSLNDLGKFAIRSQHTGAGGAAVWLGDHQGIQLVAGSGMALPGITSPFAHAQACAMNNAGTVVVRGQSQTLETGAWIWRNGTFNLVVRAGQASTAVPGAVVASLGTAVVGGGDHVLYTASITESTGQTREGLFVSHQGIDRTVALVGEPIPGTPATLSGIQAAQICSTGQVAFLGRSLVNVEGLWLSDPVSHLPVLVAATGTSFDVGAGDLRVISNIELSHGSFSGGEDGLPSFLNNRGELAFRLEFTDGTNGVFVATVPAPSIFGVALLGMWSVKRRRAAK